MAKYEVNFSCGHTEIVQFIGSYKDRERKIAWMKEHGLCSECYKAKKAKENEEINAKLPILEVSEKQIEWVKNIRLKYYRDPLYYDEYCRFKKIIEAGKITIDDALKEQKKLEAAEHPNAHLYYIPLALIAETSAKWWIDYRN